MSEPNTSEPLHSSCTRQATLVVGAAELRDVAEEIERHAADRRQEHVQIGPRDELGKHSRRSARTARAAAALPRRRSAGPCPADARPGRSPPSSRARRRCRAGSCPSGTRRPAATASFISGMLIRALVTAIDRPQIDARGELGGERRRDHVAPGIERHDPVRIRPLRMRADRLGRRRVGQVRPMVAVEPPRRDGERAVERVGARVRADRVALRGIGEARHHRPPLGRRGRAPADAAAIVPPSVRADATSVRCGSTCGCPGLRRRRLLDHRRLGREALILRAGRHVPVLPRMTRRPSPAARGRSAPARVPTTRAPSRLWRRSTIPARRWRPRPSRRPGDRPSLRRSDRPP